MKSEPNDSLVLRFTQGHITIENLTLEADKDDKVRVKEISLWWAVFDPASLQQNEDFIDPDCIFTLGFLSHLIDSATV